MAHQHSEEEDRFDAFLDMLWGACKWGAIAFVLCFSVLHVLGFSYLLVK